MSTHYICFCRNIRKILCGYPCLSGAMNLELSEQKKPIPICTDGQDDLFIYR